MVAVTEEVEPPVQLTVYIFIEAAAFRDYLCKEGFIYVGENGNS